MNLPDDQRASAARAKILTQFGASPPAAAPTQADSEQRAFAARTKIANQFGASVRNAPAVLFRAVPGVDKGLWPAMFYFGARFGDAGPGDRAFSGTAYGGGVITDHPLYARVAFDLTSTTFETPAPALYNHDAPVGVVESASIGRDIRIVGRLFAEVDGPAKNVVAMADRGMPWQLSVYIKPGSIDTIPAGTHVMLNGAMQSGPLEIFRNNRIREVSFCALGADDRTSVSIAA